MKLAIALTFIFSAQVWASCPDLQGRYECEFYGDIWTMDMTQSQDENGVTIYLDHCSVYAVTNGEIRSLPDNEEFKNAKTVATCLEGQLVMNFQADMFYNGRSAGFLEMTSEISLSSQGHLWQRHFGTSYTSDGTAYPFENLVSCLRQQGAEASASKSCPSSQIQPQESLQVKVR